MPVGCSSSTSARGLGLPQFDPLALKILVSEVWPGHSVWLTMYHFVRENIPKSFLPASFSAIGLASVRLSPLKNLLENEFEKMELKLLFLRDKNTSENKSEHKSNEEYLSTNPFAAKSPRFVSLR